jgi:pimeloyl-ACP methyl ester carboxylesterase
VTASSTISWVDRLIDSEVPLAVRDYGGAGCDVLLLHGAGRTAVDWQVMASALAGFRVVAMDLRCHGLSGDGAWTWQTLLDDIQLVITRLDLDRPALLGHSLGGIVAGLWASEHPECPAVINIDGHWPRTPALYDGIDPEIVRQRLAVLDALSPQSTPALVSANKLPELIAAQVASASAMGLDPAVAEEALRRSVQVRDGYVHARPAPDVVGTLLAEVEATDLLSVWAAAQCPLLLIVCNQDDAPPVDAPEWLPEMMAAYRRGLISALSGLAERKSLVSVEVFNGDHGLIWNQPRAIADVVTRFLVAVATS